MALTANSFNITQERPRPASTGARRNTMMMMRSVHATLTVNTASSTAWRAWSPSCPSTPLTSWGRGSGRPVGGPAAAPSHWGRCLILYQQRRAQLAGQAANLMRLLSRGGPCTRMQQLPLVLVPWSMCPREASPAPAPPPLLHRPGRLCAWRRQSWCSSGGLSRSVGFACRSQIALWS